MDIRNLMEDKVIQTVNEICDEDAKQGQPLYNDTPQCRLDVACYVLNRIPQRYVTSGRGFAYLESDFNENPQIQIDIVTLVHEGLRRVGEVQRSFYASEETQDPFPAGTKAIFYFPTIKGRLFNGLNFEPVNDVEIVIKLSGKAVKMVDGRWPNPYSIVGNTPGTYLFWPGSLAAHKIGDEQTFEFSLEVNDERFEPFRHFFSIPVRSEAPRVQKTMIRDYTVSDLYLIPRAADDEMQRSLSDDD